MTVVQRLGAVIGTAGWWVLASRRRVARANIDACFPELPEAERRALARRAMIDAGIGFAECLLAWQGNSKQWADRVTVEGMEHVRATPGPQLFLMGHMTCLELACRIVNEAFPEPSPIVVRRQTNPRVEAWIDAGRLRYAARTIGKKDLRAMLGVLKGGGRLMYGPDQNFSSNAVFVPFFGVQAATLTATAELARRTNATLIPAWAYREKGCYRVVIDPPWEGFPTGDAAADATRINEWLESRIRRAPEQYLWVHRRFRSRPPGEPPFYAPAARRRKHR